MTAIKIEVVGEQGKDVEGIKGEIERTEMTHFLIFPSGTNQKNIAVGIAHKDGDGRILISEITANMFHTLDAALRGYEQRQKEEN